MPSRPESIWPAALLGFMSTVGQVIMIRELLIASTGNELTIAVTLASWILAVAAGSFVYGRAVGPQRSPAASLFIIAALALPFQVISIRLLHPLAVGFGEMMSPAATIGLAAAGVLPAAALLGALFVAIARRASDQGARGPIALIYGLEAMGASLAGLVMSGTLLEHLDPLRLAGLAGLAGIAAATSLILTSPYGRRGIRAVVVAAGVAMIALMALGRPIDQATRGIQWSPLRVERSLDSRYNSIVVAERDGMYDFFETGVLAFSVPDQMLAEETVHIPMLCHPNPHRVLLVGGAGSGAVGEILKYGSVTSIDYVEVDPLLIATVRAFAPPGWLAGDPDVEVTAHYTDGRRFVTGTRDTYDVIIIGVGTPTTLQFNRYYTEEFFRSVGRILERDGILAMKIPSPGAYVGPDLARLVASIADACAVTFPKVSVLPGEYVQVLASPGLDLDSQTGQVLRRLEDRNIGASFVNQYVLWDRLSEQRIAALDSVLAVYDRGRPNSDLEPLAFSAAIAIWQRNFEWPLITRLGSRLNPVTAALLLVSTGILMALALAAGSHRRPRVFPGLLTLYSMGLVTMAAQVLVVLGFQITSGNIYGRIAALLAAFMAGMGLATMVARARTGSMCWIHRFEVFPALLAVPPLLVVAILRLQGGPAARLPAIIPEVSFAVVAFSAGGLGGLVFAAASRRIASSAGPLPHAASMAYSADLIGAAVGAVVTGLVLVPALGVTGAAYAVATATLLSWLVATSMGAASASRPR